MLERNVALPCSAKMPNKVPVKLIYMVVSLQKEAMDAEPMSVSPTKNWYEVVSVVQDSVTSVPSQRNSRELVAASMSWMCLTREMCKQSSDIRWTTSLQ